jgi:hypothetical protein
MVQLGLTGFVSIHVDHNCNFPYIPGFSFLGNIYDALRLGLLFYIVNLFVSISAIFAFPLYVFSIGILLYLGCDLPELGSY